MEEIEKIISQLPESLQNIIAKGQWRNKIHEIAEKYSMNDEQSDALALETLLVMISLKSMDELAINIMQEVGLDEDKSQRLAEAIKQKVLMPIESHVKRQEGIAESKAVQKEVIERVTKKPETTNNKTSEEAVAKPQSDKILPPKEPMELTEEEKQEKLDRMKILEDFENPVHTEPKFKEEKPLLATAPKEKTKPSDNGDLLKTIQGAQEKHGASVVDKKMSEPKTSNQIPDKPPIDPYREPIE